MSYDLLSNTACVPVFVPATLLKLDVPEEMMLAAIHTFNERIKEEPMEFRDNGKLKARVVDLNRTGNDLFLRFRCFDDDGYRLDDWAAKMIGFVMMNKNTGEIAEMVIEGFQWVKKKSVDFSPKV